MDQQQHKLITVTETEGQYISVVGDTYRIVITGKQTGGAYAAIDMLIPPNGGPGPHAHANFQESFLVLDGEVEIKSEEGTYIAKKGAFVNIPLGGMVHSFKNKTDTLAHLMCIVVPAGLEEMFLEIGEPVEAGTFLTQPQLEPEDIEKMNAVAEKYGQKLFSPDYFDKK